MRRNLIPVLVGTCLVAVRSLALALPAGAASTAPTGNAQAIAFYRHVAAVTRQMAGVHLVENGFTYLREIPVSGEVDWQSARAGVPAGYVPVTDEVTVAFSAGRVSWLSDVMHPRGCPMRTAHCGWGDFEVVLDGQGLRGRLTATQAACWHSDSGSVVGFSSVGGLAGYSAFGRFAALRRDRGQMIVTSTYPWTKDQRAAEIDTIAIRTHLPLRGIVHVDGSKGHRSFSFSWTNRWLRRAPAKPATPLC